MSGRDRSWDYLSFSLALLLPLLVGLYHGLRKPHSSSSFAFVFGRKEIQPWLAVPNIASLIAAPLALLLLREAASGQWTWLAFGLGFLAAFLFFTFLMLPILHYVRSPSIFAYLEERFRSRSLKLAATLVHFLGTLVYNVLLLSLVAKIAGNLIPTDAWILALLLAALAAFPALTGGLSGTLDLGLALVPLAQILIPTAALGVGLSQLEAPLNFSALNIDWANGEGDGLSAATLVPFAFLSTLTALGATQNVYQSYASLVTGRLSAAALLLALPLVALILALVAALLLIAHTMRVMSLVSFGVCVVSSNCLGQATVLWEDVLSPCIRVSKEKRQVLGLQLCVLAYALCVGAGSGAGLALVADWAPLATTAVFAANSALAALTALFVAGMFLPCVNSKGALGGLLGGLVASAALTAGRLHFHPTMGLGRSLPIPADCLLPNASALNSSLLPSSTLGPELSSTTMSTFGLPVFVVLNATTEPPPPPTTTTVPSLFVGTTAGNETPSLPQILYESSDDPRNYSTFLRTLTELLTAEDNSSALLPSPWNRSSFAAQTGANASSRGALEELCRLDPLLHPLIVAGVALFFMLLISVGSGGNDIYAMDWNLVHWTCQRCQCGGDSDRSGGGFAKRRGRRSLRGVKSAYVASESFRYARQAPPSHLDASNYRNPRVAQIDQLQAGNSTTSTSCANDAQTKLQEDFFSTLRPVH